MVTIASWGPRVDPRHSPNGFGQCFVLCTDGLSWITSGSPNGMNHSEYRSKENGEKHVILLRVALQYIETLFLYLHAILQKFKGYRPCRRPLSNLAQTRPKQQPPGDRLKNIQTPPKSGRKPTKKTSPAACRSDKSETPKGEETGSSTWTQNATQPSPDTPKTATSRRSTQNIQTPPKSGRKPSKKPSPAACRSDKSETHKGQETGSSTWTQNATQPSPDTPKTANLPAIDSKHPNTT